MRRLAVIVPLLLAACGEADPAVVAATVRVDALLKDEIKNVAFFVLGPKRSDGIVLPCDNLMNKVIEPEDSRVDGLAKVSVALADVQNQSVTLDGVAAGGDRIVYVEGKGINGTLIANGCTEYITVSSGETTTVVIDLYRF